MKQILLAITVSLMVPAYAQNIPEDQKKAGEAIERFANVIESTMNKPKPLDKADEQLVKQALEDVNKTLKTYYQIGKKTKTKSIAKGVWNTIHITAGAISSGFGGGYYPYESYSGYNSGLGMPVMTPVCVNGRAGSITQMGAFTVYNGPAFGGY